AGSVFSNETLSIAGNASLWGGATVTNGLNADNLFLSGGLNGTSPVASIAANTSFAGLVVDNSGVGDIFTASSSGLNRFVITQSGNVGIGTTVPAKTLDITGTFNVSSAATVGTLNGNTITAGTGTLTLGTKTLT